MSSEQKPTTSGEPAPFLAGTVPTIDGGADAGFNEVGDVDACRALQFEHEGLLHEFLASWLSPEPRGQEDFSVGFAAYHALAHAGMLLRMRPTGAILFELSGLSTAQRTKLVSDACDFAIGFRIPAHLKRILANGTPEPEDIEEFEHILLQRDELDVVIELSYRICANAAKTDDALLVKLSDTISVAAEFDDAFLKRPEPHGGVFARSGRAAALELALQRVLSRLVYPRS